MSVMILHETYWPPSNKILAMGLYGTTFPDHKYMMTQWQRTNYPHF